MPQWRLCLIEWPDDPDAGGPRLLGETSDPDLVEAVRSRLVTTRERELTRLTPLGFSHGCEPKERKQ